MWDPDPDTEGLYLEDLVELGILRHKWSVSDMVAKSLAKSMVDTRELYAAEDYEEERGNVELLTG